MPERMEEVLGRRVQRKHRVVIAGRFHIIDRLGRRWNGVNVMELPIDIAQLILVRFYAMQPTKSIDVAMLGLLQESIRLEYTPKCYTVRE